MSGLWNEIRRKAEAALANGSLRHIASESHFMEDGGVRFIVRRASNLARKEAPAPSNPPKHDPFMAPEPELFIADLSDTHYALLNKYNVIDRHLLVVTRAFAD